MSYAFKAPRPPYSPRPIHHGCFSKSSCVHSPHSTRIRSRPAWISERESVLPLASPPMTKDPLRPPLIRRGPQVNLVHSRWENHPISQAYRGPLTSRFLPSPSPPIPPFSFLGSQPHLSIAFVPPCSPGIHGTVQHWMCAHESFDSRPLVSVVWVVQVSINVLGGWYNRAWISRGTGNERVTALRYLNKSNHRLLVLYISGTLSLTVSVVPKYWLTNRYIRRPYLPVQWIA
jgi:hypothetical protein